MRPTRIDLEGFLSYKEPTSIDLEGATAVVIQGVNGSGKTSIVEAIGWCLFGKGRGGGPDDFISAGATETRVRVTFEIGDARYAVERQRSLSGGGKSSLSLVVDTNDHDGFGWQPVGGDSIAETQAAIEQLIGLDYETWCATSYIAQGRADQFTRLRPGERKQLLGEVLGLAVYELLTEAAKSRVSALKGQREILDRREEQLRSTLETEDQARAALSAATDGHLQARQRVTELESALEAAQGDVDTAREAAAGVARARDQLATLQRARADREGQLRRALSTTERDVQAAKTDVVRIDDELPRLRSLSQATAELEESAAQERQNAEDLEVQAVEAQTAAATARTEYSRAVDRVQLLEGQLVEIKERIATLTRVDAAHCFACEQPLPQDRRDAMVTGLTDQEGALRDNLRTANADMEGALRRSKEHEAETGRRRGEAGRIRGKLPDFEAALERARGAGEQIAAADERAAAAARRVLELQERAEALRASIAKGAETSDEERTLEETIAGAGELEGAFTKARERAAGVQDDLARARQAQDDTTTALARAEAAVEGFARAREEHRQVVAERAEVNAAGSSYATLQKAFGRDGIPTLIVENAIPAIEEEAQAILGRLTDGRLTVRLESLRANKTGGLRETLDVLVHVDGDERPLESLSGGERQCVDLALRISLARLLAHRAGSRIECLILDEAFTALDVGRRQQTIGVLNSLVDEFPLLILITHLSDLGDSFPSKLMVTNDGSTSRVETSGAAA